jgi:hypothetical protein
MVAAGAAAAAVAPASMSAAALTAMPPSGAVRTAMPHPGIRFFIIPLSFSKKAMYHEERFPMNASCRQAVP